MPITVQFLLQEQRLTPASALAWLARGGHHLALHEGDGLMIVDFITRRTKKYGYLQQTEFLRDLRTFANQGRAGPSVGPPPLRRAEPSTLGVYMGAPNTETAVHARHRLERQLRILALVLLLRHTGAIGKKAKVTLAPTTLQHGQGGVGQAAAHKAIAVPAFDGTTLHEVSDDSAVRTFLVFLVSETSIIRAEWNGADGAIEDELRARIIQMFDDIVSADDAALSLQDFRERVGALWDELRARYQTACRNALQTVFTRLGSEADNYANRTRLLAQGRPIPETELLDAKRKAAVAALITIALDVYRETAENMPFPLTLPELLNMYNLVVNKTF